MTAPIESQEAAAWLPRTFDEVFLEGVGGVMELLLIRHGEAAPLQVEDGGETYDPPLTALGRRQARALAMRLRQEGGLSRLYTSPLARTRQTARAVALELDLPVVEVYDLREVELRRPTATEPSAKTPDAGAALLRFQRSGLWQDLPYMEPGTPLRARVRRAIEDICTANPRRRVAVICHAGVINAYLADLYGIDRDMFFLPRNTSISRLRVLGEARVIERLNDAQHLAGVGEGEEELIPTLESLP